MRYSLALSYLLQSVSALTLSVDSSGGNSSSQLLYGVLYEDIYHSGDGGLYEELIRNRAFQGSSKDRVASLDRNTNFWHPVGGVTLSINDSKPALSSSLPYHLRMDVPKGATGKVGFYNEGFWGFNVDATKRYIASLHIRGDYSGSVEVYFNNSISGKKLSSAAIKVTQAESSGWKKIETPTFHPASSPGNPNNTFYFTFDGEALAGKSLHINLLTDQILKTNSFYVQKLFAANLGSQTVPVNATGGSFGPVYWSATKTADKTLLKLVHYNGTTGPANAVKVTVKGSKATTATLTVLSAPNGSSVNNLPGGGGETSSIRTTSLKAENGVFSVIFSKSYEIAILSI